MLQLKQINSYLENQSIGDCKIVFTRILENLIRHSHLIYSFKDNIEKRTKSINKMIEIYSFLLGDLNLDYQKDIIFYLKNLYEEQLKLIYDLNLNFSLNKLTIIQKVAQELLAAWKEKKGY